MVPRSLFCHLRRIASSISDGGSNPSYFLRPRATTATNSVPECSKSFSTDAVRSESSAAIVVEETSGNSESKDDLRSRIFRLRLPKRSATTVIENWVTQGNPVSISELRSISRELRRLQRYKHALEISEWMVSHDDFKLLDSDYAVRIDLMTKVFGVDAAERYFQGLPNSAKTSETCTALLHSYAAAKLIDKAEDLFETMKDLPLTAITYNEMMTLYMSVGEVEKVALVVEELKRENVEPDLFTYNIWISSCAANLDFDGVQTILDEMSQDTKSNGDWERYRDLAAIYIRSGQLSSSGSNSLVESEEKISLREWITYDFLIILHAGLEKKDTIDQIWKSLRMTKQKMASRNYMCILSAYVMLDCIKEVREVIHEWKQCTASVFSSSVYERLLAALVDAGFTEKADTLRALLNEN
ncbi:hypothetical protein V2J09_019304 [Rumex salicifolius]